MLLLFLTLFMFLLFPLTPCSVSNDVLSDLPRDEAAV